jgi:hypothetical protein
MTATHPSGVVCIGLDAAVVADHRIAIRGPASEKIFELRRPWRGWPS